MDCRRRRRRDGETGTRGGCVSATRDRHATRARVAPEALQIRLQVGSGLVAQIPFLFERPGDDPIQVVWQRVVDRARRHGVPVEDAIEDDRGRVAREALAAGRHLVEHDPERKQVGPWVQIFAARLLGRHVCDGADGGADDAREMLGARFEDGVGPAQALRVRGELGQPEVQHLHLPAPGDEDVRRLDVAVQDPVSMRGVEGVGHLHGDVEQGTELEGPAVQSLVERLALEQLHGQVALSGFFVKAVHGADVRVIERGGRARLTPEPLERFGGGCAPRGQDLDGDLAPEPRVLRAIHDTHAARPELIGDAVMPESLANQRTRHDPDRPSYSHLP